MKLYKLSENKGDKEAREQMNNLVRGNSDEIIDILFTLDDEKEEQQRKIDELEIMAPLEGGPKYKEAKERFEINKKIMSENGLTIEQSNV